MRPMMMQLYAAVSLASIVTAAPLASAADLQSDLLQTDKMTWTSRDAKQLRSVMTEDSVQIRVQNVLVGSEAIAKDAVAEPCQYSNIEFRDARLRHLTQDVVTLTYTASFDLMCEGKKSARKVVASDIWQQKNGKWLLAQYQSTPIQ